MLCTFATVTPKTVPIASSFAFRSFGRSANTSLLRVRKLGFASDVAACLIRKPHLLIHAIAPEQQYTHGSLSTRCLQFCNFPC